MSRGKLLVENILVYGFGGMLAKLVPFAMLPLVTRLMPDSSYYGLSDLSNTIVSFAQSFAIMGMYDAMFRMFFDDEDIDFKKRVCSTALFFVIGSSMIVAILLLLLKDPISRVFFGSVEYSSLVVISAITVIAGSNNSIIQAPTRMQNKRLVYIAMNLVTAILSYGIAIPLLLNSEYLTALPVAALLASLTSLLVFLILNKNWFAIRLFDKNLLGILLKLGIPIMPSFIMYWTLHSLDRIMVINIIGASAAGIYAISTKMGQISQLIYIAFSQGWQYFAFSTMNDEDQIELNSRVFEYLALASFCAASIFTCICPFIFSLMFEQEYFGGWIPSVYLFVSPLLLMLYQTAANQFLIAKRTGFGIIALTSGSLTNIVVCIILVPSLGIEGASIATLAGYIVAVVVCVLILHKMDLFLIPKRTLLTTSLYLITLVIWRLLFVGDYLFTAVLYLTLIIFYLLLYRKDFLKVLREIQSSKYESSNA